MSPCFTFRTANCWPDCAVHVRQPSAEAKLFVLDEDGRKNWFFTTLQPGARLAERRFSDGIAYSRFSEKGDRLFVLTAHQEALVLDVKKILQTSESPAEFRTISNQRHQFFHVVQINVRQVHLPVMRARNRKFTIAEIIPALRAVCTSALLNRPPSAACGAAIPSSLKIVFAPSGSGFFVAKLFPP